MVGEPRLTAEFWVRAYMARLALETIPVFVRSRGDSTAGAVLVKINTLDGRGRLMQRSLAPTGEREWLALSEGVDAEVEAAIQRQLSFDPDLWVLEVEDGAGRSLLGEPGLEA